ncbi:MAG: tRNA pseudouridine(55) synthase TruB [Ottowia sp.]|nr:tRNA pseudouridine(55) synthase TruB [Ottowia sp.]
MARSQPARKRRPVHGVLLLDKPAGLSSNQALQKVRWLLRAEKAGHTGTLDPLATGVLPICLGAATKFSQLHLDADKRYEAVLALGVRTSSGDAEGEPIQRLPVPELTAPLLASLREQFLGDLLQTPPMHSALKKDGRPLYEYARAGIHVTREPRAIRIVDLQLERVDSDPDAIRVAVTCSKGTYIRTLGEDLAAALGTCGHLASLRRIASGSLHVSDSVPLDALEAMAEAARLQHVRPVHTLLAGYETVVLDNAEAGRFLTGLRRRGSWPDQDRVAVWGDSPRALLGVARTRGGELIPVRLLSPLEIRQSLEEAP